MCVAPIKIYNKWFCPYPVGSEKRQAFEKKNPYYFLHDTTSMMLNVPCGVCPECKQLQQLSLVQRALAMSKHCYVLFGTLTYRNEALPRLEVNGYNLKFADVRDFVNLIKRMRKYKVLPDFRYMCVTEYGSDENRHHRPHFHFLFFIPCEEEFGKYDKIKGFEYAQKVLEFLRSPRGWYRALGDSFDALYYPLSKFIRQKESYTYDCHLVTGENNEDVVYYVTKYVLKFSDYVNRLQQALRLNLSLEDYYTVWSIVRPKLLTSIGMGVRAKMPNDFPYSDLDYKIEQDIQSMIVRSIETLQERPMFYFKNDCFPMCKYFIDRCMTMEQRIKFHNIVYDNPFEDESKVFEEIYEDNVSEFKKNLDKINKWKNVESRLNRNKY